MARHTKEREFLETLFKLSGAANVAAFARECGQHQSNMNDYLNGKKTPGSKVLNSCLEHLYGWKIKPVMEISEMPPVNDIPQLPGIYVFYDSGAQVLYIGKATDLRAEVRQTLGRKVPIGLRFGPVLKKVYPTFKDLTTHLSLYEVPSSHLRHNFEALLLRVFANQTHNSNVGQLPKVKAE